MWLPEKSFSPQVIERRLRVIEQERLNENMPRANEIYLLNEKLESDDMEIHDINPDGNCLFSAISHQLSRHCEEMSAMELRKLCADTLRQNRSEFEAFIVDEDFDTYCDKIESDQACWGGQIELQALSKQLKCKIIVYQAEGPNIKFGDDASEKTLCLSFHRHLIATGEHYNSVIESLQLDE